MRNRLILVLVPGSVSGPVGGFCLSAGLKCGSHTGLCAILFVQTGSGSGSGDRQSEASRKRLERPVKRNGGKRKKRVSISVQRTIFRGD